MKQAVKPIRKFAILAYLLVIVGFLMILENFGVLKGVHLLWPAFPLTLGIGLLMLFFQSERRDLKAWGIGVFLILNSFIYFWCNFTSWRILGKIWPLFAYQLSVYT